MPKPLHPSLYQINTRVWLTRLSQTLGRPATLDDIPDAELDRLAAMGFDWIWLLSSVLRFRDLMGTLAFDRDGHDLDARGLYLDMPPWGHHIFEVTAP